jgi:hypothetical protein
VSASGNTAGDADLTAGVGMPRAEGQRVSGRLLDGFRGILQSDCYSAYGNTCGNHAGRLLGARAGQVSRNPPL